MKAFDEKHKIAIFLADGFETCEALVVFDFLKRAKIDVELVNANLKNTKEVVSAQGVEIINTTPLNEIIINNYSGIIIPGGQPGTNNLLVNSYFKEMITKFISSTDGFVAAICAAPFLLDK
jgi:4-methyl-5(b-hydroxyethyl)-thiazole monophosphate biosynthesis